MPETYEWTGKSGKVYTYIVYGLNADWNDIAGNYIYAAPSDSGWTAAYIGQTDSFQLGLRRHNIEDCALNNGATRIHAHANADGEAARSAEQADLIAAHRPPCNAECS